MDLVASIKYQVSRTKNREQGINMIRSMLAIQFHEGAGGSSFRWNDNSLGDKKRRFRPSPEFESYGYLTLVSTAGMDIFRTAILKKVRISSIQKKMHVIR